MNYLKGESVQPQHRDGGKARSYHNEIGGSLTQTEAGQIRTWVAHQSNIS